MQRVGRHAILPLCRYASPISVALADERRADQYPIAHGTAQSDVLQTLDLYQVAVIEGGSLLVS